MSALERMTNYFREAGLLGEEPPANPEAHAEWRRRKELEFRESEKPKVVIQNFVDPTASIGGGSVIWHFARVLANARIGKDCSIGSCAEIGRGASIGDRTRISSGVFIPSNAVIGADVFIGPNVTMTDDRHPQAGNSRYQAEPPVIDNGASIGAGAILLPGVKIGHHAFVAAGAIVTKDVPPNTSVRCEPAREFQLSSTAMASFTGFERKEA